MATKIQNSFVVPPAVQPTPAQQPSKIENSFVVPPAGLTPSDSFTPAASTNDTGNLVNHGGGVLSNVNVVPVYVGNYWNGQQGQADRKHNDAAIADLVKNPGMVSVWQQYGAGAGTTAKSHVITEANPKVMTQADIESLVQQQVAAGKFDTSNPQTMFNIVLPPGTELQNGQDSSHQGLGGYHGSVNVNGKEVYYSAIAYSAKDSTSPSGVNGIDFTGNAQDNVSITESHEITEAVTDPNVEVAIRNNDTKQLGWYDDSTAWTNPSNGQQQQGKGEIGDVTILNSELDGDKTLASAWGRSDGYAFQKEWSNQDGQSELQAKGTPTPTPAPTPSPTPTPAPTPSPSPTPITLPPDRSKGNTEIEAILTINKYEGMVHGRNGDHETADATITLVNAVNKKQVLDTMNVQLAMNVASSKDPAGLPHEIPLVAGQQIEVEGEYIPGKTAGDHGEAVIHFTHSPDGYAIIDGQKYS